MSSLMDSYSNEEFEQIVLNSHSYKECLFNLGYHSNSGDSTNRLKQKIQILGISTEHFTSKTPIARTEENIFCENSSADQSTLRKWFTKGNYQEYVCSICGQEPEWQGKPLTLILDHINGNNKDDRLENLRWVCPNCNQQLETTNGKNKIRANYTIAYCVDCGKKISKNATRCSDCHKKFLKTNEVQGITREELKNLIRTTPFTTIGKKFNVSDNAVRKWCDKYQLPNKAREIKKFSDEEWSKI